MTNNTINHLNLDKPDYCLKLAIEHATKKISGEIALTAMFPQLWDTPALGFLGVAAAQDTVAYTTILTPVSGDSIKQLVYFNGIFAYEVNNPNQQFIDDVAAQRVGSILYQSDYERISEIPTDQQIEPDGGIQ